MNPTKKSYDQQFKEARILYDKSQYHAAQEKFESLMENFPDKAAPHFFYGACSLALGDSLKSLGYFLKAASLEPDNAEYLAWAGKNLQLTGHNYLAMKKFNQALELDASNLTALSDLGSLYTQKSLDSEAIVILRKAISIKPSYAHNYAAIALSLARQGESDEAITCAKKAIQLQPKEAGHYTVLGNVYLIQGNIQEAIKNFKKAIDIDPLLGHAYYSITISKKITPEDRSMINKMEAALNKSMSSTQRRYFLFGLGKAYDDLKNHEKSFSYIEKANMLIHSDYDPASHTKTIRKTKNIYSTGTFSNVSVTSQGDRKQIFIIGMPRSGSTLIEQILSTHTKVHSVGESAAMIDVMEEIRSHKKTAMDFPEYLKELDKEELENSREIYIKETWSNAKENITHILDKNLFNFLCLGLITSMFPDAKIIHAYRNPLDTCLSCYMTGFSFTESTWTHNLEYIGKYYRDYVDLMNHWRKVLPCPVLEIRYEDMVLDTEANARRILEFCDLEWEDACLDFYKAKRGINTASFWQVRQPIYKTAIQRWVAYAEYLQPLILALGDLVENDYEKIESLGLRHGPRHNSIHGKISRLFS